MSHNPNVYREILAELSKINHTNIPDPFLGRKNIPNSRQARLLFDSMAESEAEMIHIMEARAVEERELHEHSASSLSTDGGGPAAVDQGYSIQYLVVGGGGGGGYAGGGGGGGFLQGTRALIPGTTYSITVGDGGIGLGYPDGPTQGQNSVFSDIVAIGGGSGGYEDGVAGNGGSGGGGSAYGPTAYGEGTPGQGNRGGLGAAAAGGGGGGGAGETGYNGSPPWFGGNGGNGLPSSITGTELYYAGGGGGGYYDPDGTYGSGGFGGGGAGDDTPGEPNTGGGGGGYGSSIGGANGGSGVVILSIPTANYTGTTTGTVTVTTVGSNKVLTFTSGTGSYTA
jgi:hypothetical protein